LAIYTWPDATLRELTEHVTREVEAARKKGVELRFSLIFPDKDGKLKRKELGSVFIGKKG
jgi:histone deacetylase complex subunit SAP18